MAYVADLHIHSRFAGACSGELTIPNLSHWARLKGVQLLSTGDALHPLWQQELKKDLTNIGGGVYQNGQTSFIIGGEIACIYYENEKMHRIHLIILYPCLESALKLSEVLTKMGAKLASDGRPILGISSKKLCEIIFKVEPKALIIPAHIWTPWFSLYGSKSGYERLVDCFGEFSEKIYAVETGISSEPAMNWRVADLDDKSIVSFSDLHSLPRLGREVTIFGGEINFDSLTRSFKNENIIGTIEFFPEEGKYHYSGHRNCNVVYDSEQLKKFGDTCPKCKRKLTIGVLQRVEELATRSEKSLQLKKVDGGVIKSATFPDRPGFRMLIQLEEIIAESLGVAVKTQKVQNKYQEMTTQIDSELKILTKTPIELLSMVAGEKIAEGIDRVRKGQLKIEPGFDNTYGKVQIWEEKQ